MPKWFFSSYRYQKFRFLPLKSGFLAQKKAKFGPNYAFLKDLPARLVPCWLVVLARGLYLARQLFTLLSADKINAKNRDDFTASLVSTRLADIGRVKKIQIFSWWIRRRQSLLQEFLYGGTNNMTCYLLEARPISKMYPKTDIQLSLVIVA